MKSKIGKAVYNAVAHTVTLVLTGNTFSSGMPAQAHRAGLQPINRRHRHLRSPDRRQRRREPWWRLRRTARPQETVTKVATTTSRAGITGVVLNFNLPLDAARAQNLASYTLISAGADGRFGTADDRLISLKKATYKASNKTVTLTPTVALPKTQAYQLTVNGTSPTTGLEDVNGNLLDGNRDGVAGGKFVGQFGAPARSSISAVAFDSLTVHDRLPRTRKLAAYR